MILTVICLSSLVYSESTSLNLSDALKNNKVQVKLVTLGGHSDSSVQMTLQNNTASMLSITIPKGTLFVPADDGEQTLVLTEDHLLSLAPNRTKSIHLNALCTELSDRSPSEKRAMTLSFTNNKSLLDILDYAANKPELKGLIQDAIWVATDGQSVSHINASSPLELDFRKKVASLCHQENPWYTSPQQRQLTATREIVSITKKIRGELYFDMPISGSVYQAIYAQDGTELMRSKDSQTLRPGKNIHFTFNIEVTGWQSGAYYVTLNHENRVINKYDFTI